VFVRAAGDNNEEFEFQMSLKNKKMKGRIHTINIDLGLGGHSALRNFQRKHKKKRLKNVLVNKSILQ